MKQLLIQSDDYGITYGVADGTLRAIREGLVKNTGLFVNMASSAYAASQIKNVQVCLGIDVNLAAGFPVSGGKAVPHLVDEQGHFKSSRRVLEENKLISTEKYLYHFEEDPYNYEEVLLETENQVKRFIELIGRKPDYMNSHSVITPNTERAALEVAKAYGIPRRSSELYFGAQFKDLAYQGDYQPSTAEEQLEIDLKGYILNYALPSIQEDQVAYLICHCGYMDKDLLRESSLTLQRINDLECAVDPDIMRYIQEHEIQLITYRDLVL